MLIADIKDAHAGIKGGAHHEHPARLFRTFAVRIKLRLMNTTVFLTVLSGVLTYVIGQLVVKLVIDPVQEAKKTIGQIAHTMIEKANVISNPGVLSAAEMDATSQHLRQLSSQLNSHLYLVPLYSVTARLFRLPPIQNMLKASSNLIGLSNSLDRAGLRGEEVNAKRVEAIHDLLGIFFDEGRRWPKEVA